MENIIGHENVKIILKRMLEEDKIAHAYLFVGKEGIGKKKMAIEFAKQIMSRNGSTFNEADFQLLLPDDGIIKIDAIRKLINEIYLKPAYSSSKVIIIDDADEMNINAQNALLKVLEEPPIYATIILIATNKEKIIKTILSRVTEIKFQQLSNDELKRIVGESDYLEYARGSASKALDLLDNSCLPDAEELFKLITKKDFLLLNKKIADLKQSSADIIRVLEVLKIIYFQKIKENTCESVTVIQHIEDTIKVLNRNGNIDLALDKLMIETCL